MAEGASVEPTLGRCLGIDSVASAPDEGKYKGRAPTVMRQLSRIKLYAQSDRFCHAAPDRNPHQPTNGGNPWSVAA